MIGKAGAQWKGVLVLLFVLIAAGCSASTPARPTPAVASSPRSTTPTVTPTVATAAPDANHPCGVTSAPPPQYQHVVVVIMENKTLPYIRGSAAAPYENQLMRQCGYATDWRDAGAAYDSEPNYIAWASGINSSSTLRPYGCDCPPPAGASAATCRDGVANCTADDNLFRQAVKAGLMWKSYQEGMGQNCQEFSSGRYAVKHNPAAFFFGGSDHQQCLANDIGSTVPLYQAGSPLMRDIVANTLPALTEITPDLCNDTHDCATATGDDYLSQLVPALLNSPAYRAGKTAVIVMWDEDTPIPNMVIAPSVVPASTAGVTSHYGCLRAVEEMLGLPRLGGAAFLPNNEDLRSLFAL